ncbi:SDR family oxidoreductase [Novosphingobium sp. 9U]|uniref:SDR family NAD(P)-dependent oxidoreductase n=1 Tax=Novosphingobium sp. 9U TaxID=2653158 RepID=UPI0012F43374|nr:SDR family NAD(P)-dependent oxidoreductase [Novosphingobium sp. 9U]VWX48837.1 Short-chain dehydrogenase [Novosphingobium sp. 9U]
MDKAKYGPWALIIGGSEGIGSAFARKLAADGFNIAVVARKPGPLEALAEELRGMGVEARSLSVDLSDTSAIDQVRTITDDIEVGLLIYNAGANNIRGNFVELDPKVYRDVINITVVGQAEFAHHFGALMRERGRGGIILAGSSSNFCGAPTLATYTAAKSFSRILTESLWLECEPMGIDVLHISINYTDTPAMQRLGYDTSSAQSPEEVAQEALDNIANGPLLILGGQRALDTAIARSQLENRGEMIRALATPRRENIPQKA